MRNLTATLCLTLAVLLGSAGVSWSDDWTKVETNEDGNTYYLNYKDIDKRGRYVSFWVLGDYAEANSTTNSLSGKVYHRGDCELFRLQILTYRFYKKPMGRGELVSKFDPKSPSWDYPRPDTSLEKILNQICAFADRTRATLLAEVVKFSDLVERGGITYKVTSDTPFTGKVSGIDRGQYKRGEYRNGLKHRLWITFWEDGKLKLKKTFKDGQVHGQVEKFHKNGRLARQLSYKNGKQHGPDISYTWDNGRISGHGEYKNGKKDGPWNTYCFDGKIFLKQTYEMGRKHGHWVYYSCEDGSVLNKGEHRKGKKVGLWIQTVPSTGKVYQHDYGDGSK